MLHRTAIITVTALILALAGCSSLLDDNWGRSFETARHNQIQNPEADQNLAPVEGLEGPSALRVLETYRKGGAEQKKSTSSVGVLTLQK